MATVIKVEWESIERKNDQDRESFYRSGKDRKGQEKKSQICVLSTGRDDGTFSKMKRGTKPGDEGAMFLLQCGGPRSI